jgi:membrane fusion protein (multidrug efflux system)
LGFRGVSLGTLVQPGERITTLDDVSLIKLDFSIPETFLAALSVGLEIEASAAAYPGEPFLGTVKVVDSRVNPVTRAVTVRAELQNPDRRLRPGMLLTVEVFKDRRASPSVPEASLLPVSDRTFVYRVRDAQSDEGTAQTVAERVEIVTGRRIPGHVEVLDGLALGDRVVVEGLQRLRDGSPVQVTGETEPENAEVAGEAIGEATP